jgi:hypothetical protein
VGLGLFLILFPDWMTAWGVKGRRDSRACPTPQTVIPGYTLGMKTAISVPDETFEKASRRAHDLGMSRSEFFTRAAARYLDELDAESVTRQIDLAVAALAEQDDSAADAVVVGQRVLADAAGAW